VDKRGVEMDICEVVINQMIEIIPAADPEKIRNILSQYEIYEKNTDEGKDIKEKIAMFLSAKKIEGLSQLTTKSYSIELRTFAKHMLISTEKITTTDIRRYLGMFNELKLGSLTTKLSILKSFFGWLAGEEIIPRDPTRKVKAPKKEKRLPKALTIEELELIRESCRNMRERALVEVFYATGARLSELVHLNRNDIDFANSCATVFGKGSKERKVYFSVRAMFHLKKYLMSRLDDENALFVTERKPYRRLMNRSIQAEFKKIALKAGVKKNVHPHVFRHTLATLMLNNGADLVSVQNILGHEDPATTQVYAQITEQRKQDQYKKFMIQ
jgi:integrase/recombinase XerD